MKYFLTLCGACTAADTDADSLRPNYAAEHTRAYYPARSLRWKTKTAPYISIRLAKTVDSPASFRALWLAENAIKKGGRYSMPMVAFDDQYAQSHNGEGFTLSAVRFLPSIGTNRACYQFPASTSPYSTGTIDNDWTSGKRSFVKFEKKGREITYETNATQFRFTTPALYNAPINLISLVPSSLNKGIDGVEADFRIAYAVSDTASYAIFPLQSEIPGRGILLAYTATSIPTTTEYTL